LANPQSPLVAKLKKWQNKMTAALTAAFSSDG
jgi:hypothetical protein